jgi:hypothetical protein
MMPENAQHSDGEKLSSPFLSVFIREETVSLKLSVIVQNLIDIYFKQALVGLIVPSGAALRNVDARAVFDRV